MAKKMSGNGKVEYGEFKGSTETTLKLILQEVKGLREDVDGLKMFKAYTLGVGAVAGFLAGFLKDFITFKGR